LDTRILCTNELFVVTNVNGFQTNHDIDI